MSEAIGIMDKAYFVSKGEILKWLGDTLEHKVDKVEDAHSAWMYCQIMDCIFPGQVPLHKVNFNARTEYDKIQNYKVLQDVFTRQEIRRHIDVGKLVKGKFQDNMEFCQWLKHFFSVRYNGQPYAAAERREQAMNSYSKGHKYASSKVESKVAASINSRSEAKPESKSAMAAPKRAAPAKSSASSSSASSAPVSNEEAESKIQELTTKLSKMRVAVEGLEKERDFYFGKLRRIEILCQNDDVTDCAQLKQEALDILYATDDEEFESPEGQATEGEAPAAEEM